MYKASLHVHKVATKSLRPFVRRIFTLQNILFLNVNWTWTDGKTDRQTDRQTQCNEQCGYERDKGAAYYRHTERSSCC